MSSGVNTADAVLRRHLADLETRVEELERDRDAMRERIAALEPKPEPPAEPCGSRAGSHVCSRRKGHTGGHFAKTHEFNGEAVGVGW